MLLPCKNQNYFSQVIFPKSNNKKLNFGKASYEEQFAKEIKASLIRLGKCSVQDQFCSKNKQLCKNIPGNFHSTFSLKLD